MSGNKGLDIGTNLLVAGSINDKGISSFVSERDAFFRIEPKSEVNSKSIKASLESRGSSFIVDGDDYIVCGEDALQIAIERNSSALRPMMRGVISPQEASNLPMLKLLIQNLVGKGSSGDKLVYSVPAKPIDEAFDVVYHKGLLDIFLGSLGYKPTAINEGYAIILSEALSDHLTAVSMSTGAGMINVCVAYQGDVCVEFSTTKSGDFIDMSVGNALDINKSFVQFEKEAGIDLYDHKNNKIIEAVNMYYRSVFRYTCQQISYELKKRKKDLPLFREPVPFIVSGGLSLAKGFTKMFKECLDEVEMPMKISEIRLADNPVTCVANGCLLAAQL